jgi:hypothetical protein
LIAGSFFLVDHSYVITLFGKGIIIIIITDAITILDFSAAHKEPPVRDQYARKTAGIRTSRKEL